MLLRDALPNALPATIQAIGLTFLYLAGGIVLVEYVFAYPGIGAGLVNAVTDKDIPVIQFIVILLAAFYVFINIAADVVPCGQTPAPGAPMTATGCLGGAVRPSGAALGARSSLRDTPRTARGRVARLTFRALWRSSARSVLRTERVRDGPGQRAVRLPARGDFLGRDVLSRVLAGGWQLIVLAAAATVIGVVLGAAAGIYAGYRRGLPDTIVMRAVDVLLAFPQIVFVLLLVSVVGPSDWLLVVAVGLSHAPQVARVLRASTLDVSERDFVKAVEITGVSGRRVMLGEILPNLVTPLMVEIGLRMTYSIVIMAGLSFIGFGLPPPQPNWGTMINENRIGLTLNAWAALTPAVMIAVLTIGLNTFTRCDHPGGAGGRP